LVYGPADNLDVLQFVGFNDRQYGPVFGDRITGVRGGVLLTDRAGGFIEAADDLDRIARYNGYTPLELRGIVDAPPAGWIMRGGRNEGFIIQHLASRLQLRVSGGQAHIDIPMGTRIGDSISDISWSGEVVHYND
jgi:hypothetical protein